MFRFGLNFKNQTYIILTRQLQCMRRVELGVGSDLPPLTIILKYHALKLRAHEPTLPRDIY